MANEQRQRLLSIHQKPVSVNTCIVEGEITINPQMAQTILDCMNYSRQRPIAKHHVKSIVDKMLSGAWIPGHSLNFAKINGSLILVNGQHRLQAIVECGCKQKFNVIITNAKTMDEVHKLYCTHDTGGRTRSLTEILTAAGVAQRTGLSNRATKALYESALLLETNFERVRYQNNTRVRNHDYRIECAFKWAEEARAFSSAVAAADNHLKGKLFSQGIMAVGLATFKFQASRAEEFWKGLAEGVNLSTGDPRYAFARDLRNRPLSVGNSQQGERSAAVAWNAFFANRRLKIIKVFTDSSITIAGTPWR